MRHLTAAMVATAVLLLGAGCGDNGPAEADTAATTSAAPTLSASAPPDAHACVDVKAVHLQYSVKFSDNVEKDNAAMKKGDAAAGDAAVKELRATAIEWVGKLEPLAAQVQGPELRKALDDLVAALKRYNAGDGVEGGNDLLQRSRDVTAELIKSCP
ncbi:hypothetical protein ACQP2P_00435 [Dactylosporangium sp. CA-139114]|uniref:hypothetical protein n=1 Tax=Dactylosporangium sp. CA-139114 TaxID=3239931 RepID=UPI003D990150